MQLRGMALAGRPLSFHRSERLARFSEASEADVCGTAGKPVEALTVLE